MNLQLTEQAARALCIWETYQNMLAKNSFRNATHKKIIVEQEHIWREEVLNVTEYLVPQIMEAAGGTLINGDITF